MKRKTSRFGLGQFLGSSSGASQTCPSYSYPTASNTLTHRTAYSAHITTHSVTSSHSQPPQPPSNASSHHPPCPIHYPTSTMSHHYPPPNSSFSGPSGSATQHFLFSSSSSHPPNSSSIAPVATTSTLTSTHSQSHQYLVHCVAPSQTLIHSPMPTLQEAEHHKQQTKSQPSTQSHQYPYPIHSYHSHFQKHPSAPNLLPPPTSAPAPSPTPSASAMPMSCTCDVGCTQASTSASAPAPQGRL